MKYRSEFWDVEDCGAWAGPVLSRLGWFTGRVADFLYDQLYDWFEITDGIELHERYR